MNILPIDFNKKSHIYNDYLALTVGDLIDIIFSHNEIISLNVPKYDENGLMYSQQIWRGHAHELPIKYKDYLFYRIFGCVAESIVRSDTIYILCDPPSDSKIVELLHERLYNINIDKSYGEENNACREDN